MSTPKCRNDLFQVLVILRSTALSHCQLPDKIGAPRDPPRPSDIQRQRWQFVPHVVFYMSPKSWQPLIWRLQIQSRLSINITIGWESTLVILPYCNAPVVRSLADCSMVEVIPTMVPRGCTSQVQSKSGGVRHGRICRQLGLYTCSWSTLRRQDVCQTRWRNAALQPGFMKNQVRDLRPWWNVKGIEKCPIGVEFRVRNLLGQNPLWIP